MEEKMKAFILALILGTISITPCQAEGVIVGPNSFLRWDQNAATEHVTGYVVEWAASSGATSGTYTGSQAVATDAIVVSQNCVAGQHVCATTASLGIPNGQNYVVVKAVNVVGDSPRSNEVPFVLLTIVPSAPSGVGAMEM